MATITPPRPHNLADDSRRVHDPLDRLRGYIRAYVSLEGVLVALLFVVVLFWAAFVFDYLFFKLTGVDWVQVLPFWMRSSVAGLLVVALVALVFFKAVVKLFREFKDRSLALVLEKRFPKILGQRLITAVELSDPDKAAQYGYSRMVAETIHEAAEAVDQLPLKEVFDWNRLIRRAVWLLIIPAIGIVLAGAVDGTLARFVEKKSFWTGFTRFPDAALTLGERDLALQYVPWPRNAHLDVIEPSVAELRVGRDAAAPTVRVRASRYIIADRGTFAGWRPLTHQDLIKRPELLTKDVDVPEPPADWAARDEDSGLTIDEIVLRLNRFYVRKRSKDDGKELQATWIVASSQDQADWRPLLWSDLRSDRLGGLPVPKLSAKWDPRAWPAAGAVGVAGAESTGSLQTLANLSAGPLGLTVDEVEGQLGKDGFDSAEVRAIVGRLERINDLQIMMDRLNERAALASLSRTLRKLPIPSKVNLVYRGKSTSFRKDLQPAPENEVTGNEFTGTFTDLKAEAYRYNISAEDYSSATQRIVVLPPPALVSLNAEQSRPAYLYYRPGPDSDGRELRGLKQPFEPIDVANLGSDVSRIEVPAGSDLVLVGKVNVDLHGKDGVKVRPFREGDRVDAQLTWSGDTFRALFKDVRIEQNLVFVLKDADGVAGSRQVLIKPKDDAPPELIDVNPDVVRKTKDGYMVSVSARVPFVGRVRDDNGLAGVRYAYTLAKVDSGLKLNVQALRLLIAAPPLAAGHNGLLAGLLYATAQREGTKAPENDAAANQKVERLPNLPAFDRLIKERQLRDGKAEVLPLATVAELLEKQQKLPYRTLLTDLELKPDTWMNAESDPLGYDFAVWKLKLKSISVRDIQPRYKMQLWVEATDTDVDTDAADKEGKPRPHVSPSKEKFTFFIVSEAELLTEIAKEEEELRIKLEEVYNILQEGESKVVRETLDLASPAIKPEVLGPMGGRIETLDQLFDKQVQKTKEVHTDYLRILRELRVNQVDSKMIDQVEKGIVTPLGDLDGEFARSHDALTSFRKALEEARSANAAGQPAAILAARAEGTKSRDQVRALKESMARILDKMARLKGINDLIATLRKIEEQEQAQSDILKKIREDLERKLLEDAGVLPVKPKK